MLFSALCRQQKERTANGEQYAPKLPEQGSANELDAYRVLVEEMTRMINVCEMYVCTGHVCVCVFCTYIVSLDENFLLACKDTATLKIVCLGSSIDQLCESYPVLCPHSLGTYQ